MEPGDTFGHIDFRMAMSKKSMVEDDESSSNDSEGKKNDSDSPLLRDKKGRRGSKNQNKLRNPKWCRMFTMRTI